MVPTLQIECLDCGYEADFHPMSNACPNCGGLWRRARYPLKVIAERWRTQLAARPFNLWRYQESLPGAALEPDLRLGEGGTPLLPARNLGLMLGLKHLYIKDERQGPTASFKDRQAAVTIAVLRAAGISEAVVASTGNVAIAYSAFCARAGIKLWAFLTSLVPADKMHEVALYGTKVVKVTATYDQAKQLAAEFAAERGLYLDQGVRSIAAVEAMKTIGLEIAEQLGAIYPPGPDEPFWRAPDWYVQAVSGGIGPVGVLKGLGELDEMGWLRGAPALAAIQSSGCAPMAEAWKNKRADFEPVTNPTTHISTLSTGNPGRTYSLLRQTMLDRAAGTFESVTDEEAFAAMHTVAKMEGLSIEPAAGVAFAGLFKLARAGNIQSEQIVVVNCSGHTMPIEKQLLGEDWSREVSLPAPALPESPQEGLLAALANLDDRRVRSVLIVDDHAPARLLIRRIIQAQGDFEVREVSSGGAALQEAEQRPPDLIILDLMMPEMDGFTVLEYLKSRPQTAEVPVIVVTAKELTSQEKSRLKGQISRLMVKGDFLTDELFDEINQALG